MKEYKVIQMNDGRPEAKTNGNWHYGEENRWIQKMLDLYAAVGFRVVAMAADFRPGRGESGEYAFYKDGYMFTLEREGGGLNITTEMWNAVNSPTLSDDAFEQMKECLRNGGTAEEFFAIYDSDGEEPDLEDDEPASLFDD